MKPRPPLDPLALLQAGLRRTPQSLDARFEAWYQTLEKPRSAAPRWGRPALWGLGLAAACFALVFGVAPWKGQPASDREPGATAPLYELAELDQTLLPAQALKDPQLLVALLEMPLYENH